MPERQKKIDELTSQLWGAGLTGLLKGSLIGLISGFYLNYRYNYGHNAKFFNTPYKIAYLVSWNFIFISFAIESEKIKMRKQLAMEEQIKRDIYMEEELNINKK
ncbi:uncharacterized protein AC631_01067 [Debaryomyces fabryi]|uniref:Uncharacterized protein n=1 Tax=Debaryomyces fabryi TaxID=58627 RepID=A0A0V1Q3X8_9ASCO|nr:uncharacterized protein AC631_01067 [Debaryomyces fabryi]KSA03170.1 hypothetical protein AC631_01067 [Debaryomyces fabryi]